MIDFYIEGYSKLVGIKANLGKKIKKSQKINAFRKLNKKTLQII